MVNLVIWNEFVHEQEDEHVKSIYCNGRTYTREEFLKEKENYLLKKKQKKDKTKSSV